MEEYRERNFPRGLHGPRCPDCEGHFPSAVSRPHSIVTPVAGVLDPFAGGARPSFVALAAASAYSLLGRLDSLNTVRTRRSFYLRASRRLCCLGQREKATASKLSNLPSLRRLRRIGRHALETKTPFCHFEKCSNRTPRNPRQSERLRVSIDRGSTQLCANLARRNVATSSNACRVREHTFCVMRHMFTK
jgi:hypothetical protein